MKCGKKPHLRITECCAVCDMTCLEGSGDGDAGWWLRWLGVVEWYRRTFMAVDVWWLRWAAAIVDGWWLRWMDETGWYRRLMTKGVWRIRETTETRWFQRVATSVRGFSEHFPVADLKAQGLGRTSGMLKAGWSECWISRIIHAERISGRFVMPRCLNESKVKMDK